jgi:hypothetical protein
VPTTIVEDDIEAEWSRVSHQRQTRGCRVPDAVMVEKYAASRSVRSEKPPAHSEIRFHLDLEVLVGKLEILRPVVSHLPLNALRRAAIGAQNATDADEDQHVINPPGRKGDAGKQ